MDLDNKIILKRLFRDNPELASSIHKGGNHQQDFESLAEKTGIALNFLLMHKGYICRMVFDI